MSTYDFNYTLDSFGNEDAKSYCSNPENDFNEWSSSLTDESEEDDQEILVQQNQIQPRYDHRNMSSEALTTPEWNLRRSGNHQLPHQAESAEWKRRYELEILEYKELNHKDSRITETITYNSESFGNQDANILYSNPEDDLSDWFSLTQSKEAVQQTRKQTTYDRQIMSPDALRTVEAEAAEWKDKYELVKSENQELQRKAAEAKAAEWKQKYELVTSENQKLQHEDSYFAGTISAKFHPGLLHVCLSIIFNVYVVESLMMVVAYLVPNFLIGFTTGAGFIGITMVSSRCYSLLPDLPKIFCHYTISYTIFGSWAIQGGYKNDLIEPLSPGEPKMVGEEVIMKEFGVKAHSEWRDLTSAIVVIIVCSRLLFFVALTLKEKARPTLKAIQAKIDIHMQFSS
ncbi:hypothetical protein AALP_AA3G242000 [Arabis alpina]|uniref:Uncharacterized protein n=1 Tax=Arabis alpina TaxID=50452 RepID=A0A087HBB4_ARAAL|nr:hypothetical protein AALP_AA3G242000 [Arabis alpina]